MLKTLIIVGLAILGAAAVAPAADAEPLPCEASLEYGYAACHVGQGCVWVDFSGAVRNCA